MSRKIIAVFMACMVVAATLVSPVFATDYQSTYNYWNWLYDNSWFVGKSIASLADSVCSVSDDGLHHATVPSGGFGGGDRDGVRTYTCVCDYCAQEFTVTATELENTYNEWGKDNSGTIYSDGRYSVSGKWSLGSVGSGLVAEYGFLQDDVNHAHVSVSVKRSDIKPYHEIRFQFTAPFNATVVFDGVFQYAVGDAEPNEAFRVCQTVSSTGSLSSIGSGNYVDGKRSWPVTEGITYRYSSKTVYTDEGVNCTVYYNLPSVYLLLDDPSAKYQEIPVYGGGNLSFSVDNSETVYKTTQFINTDTNTFYNPATNTTSTLQSWQYDYDNRTYTGYTENGDVTIVYGDENITVIEGGNTYNYYYASPTAGGNGSESGDGSGDGSGGDGLLGKLGELLGTFLGGIIDLITGVLNRILDSLITLAEMTLEKLGNIVNLFGSFGDALRSLWSWLPADVIEVLVAGVTVIVFCAVIKLFV